MKMTLFETFCLGPSIVSLETASKVVYVDLPNRESLLSVTANDDDPIISG
jgi:hypothetical protein